MVSLKSWKKGFRIDLWRLKGLCLCLGNPFWWPGQVRLHMALIKYLKYHKSLGGIALWWSFLIGLCLFCWSCHISSSLWSNISMLTNLSAICSMVMFFKRDWVFSDMVTFWAVLGKLQTNCRTLKTFGIILLLYLIFPICNSYSISIIKTCLVCKRAARHLARQQVVYMYMYNIHCICIIVYV